MKMKMKSLKKTLMERDNISAIEATNQISSIQDSLAEHLDNGDMDAAFYVLDDLGLEPDYLLDLL